MHKNVSTVDSYQDIDSKGYIENAIRFCNTNSFVNPDAPKSAPYFALGYAFFLGVIYKIFGVNNSYITWIQVLLALLTGFLIFRATKTLFNKKIALISFAIFSFNLGFIVFSQFILTEILLTFLLVLFLERFVSFLKKEKLRYLIQAGLALGLSVTVKPAAIYFIFLLILFLMLFVGSNFSYKFKAVILLAMSFYLPVVGYMVFNKVNFGYFQVSPLGNENLYFYLLPKVLAHQNKTDAVVEQRNVVALVNGNKLSKESWEKVKALFMENFKKDPILFVRIWLQNVGKTFLGLFSSNLKVLVEPNVHGGDISFFKTKGNFYQRIWSYAAGGTDSLAIKFIGAMEAFWTILRYILCLIALLFLFYKRRWSELFFLTFFIFYFSMITGHDGCARFRMMFEPILILLSALGIYQVFYFYFKREKLA